MLQKSLFDPNNDMETLFLRQQVAAIVFHTLVATFVTFFLDLDCNKDKVLCTVMLIIHEALLDRILTLCHQGHELFSLHINGFTNA